MIECINFREHISGTLLGFANLFVPKWGLEIYGCSLHKKGDRRWLNLPSREYQEEGEKKYASTMRLREKDHYEFFCRQAKEAVDTWINENEKKKAMEQEGSQMQFEIEGDSPDSDAIPF